MFSNLRALYQVMRDGKLPRRELEKLVHERLKTVLVSAFLHVPYYRELMQSIGYDPVRDYSGPGDLSNLPITTKQVLKEKGISTFLREGSDLSACFNDATSGSTGIPLRVYRAPYERSLQIAKWLRVLFINGYAMRDKVMSLTSPARLAEGRSIIQRFGILRRLAVNYLLPPEEMVEIFLAYKPEFLYGNRSHLDLMALELKRRRIQPEELGLKSLIGTAEVIHQSSRQLYRKHFGVGLSETYGSVEMGTMAYETHAHDGLHLCEDMTYFEFLNEQGEPVSPGVPGRVVVTDLIGMLMPFIRYDQGDLAVFEYADGVNGNGSRRLTRIIGREDDYALLPDGTRRPFHDFYEVMDKYADIMQFRIVQRTRSQFQILIVADSSYLLRIRDDLLYRLQEKFPGMVNFEIVQVEQISPDSSGKIRMLVSEVVHVL